MTVCQPLWRKWIVLAALVCTVWLYSDAITHHHVTLAQEMGCPVCHVVGQNSISDFVPPLPTLVQVVSWFHSDRPAAFEGEYRHVLDLSHLSRAPPRKAPQPA